MSNISHYPGDFYRDLGEWVRGFTQAQDLKRRREESLRSKLSSIDWYDRELIRLEEKRKRKPSAIHQITEYRYAKRRLELEIAFENF